MDPTKPPDSSNDKNPGDSGAPLEPLSEMTPEKLQEQLTAYQTAIREEFEVSVETDPMNAEKYCTDFFKKNLPMFAAQVAFLAGNADSESVRLAASKLGIQLAREDSDNDGDGIGELLKKLQANAKEKV